LLVLQDFEALTPNTLCRTIETVEGGGLVIFLVKTMASLQQLYSITMDVHSRFRTHQFQDVQPRFNERFILSLSTLRCCLFMDDELNLLPVSSQSKLLVDVERSSTAETEIQQLVSSLKGGHEIVYSLVSMCRTVD
jgi:N-acetyltransferase 10